MCMAVTCRLTPEQAAVMEPPYNVRLDRPMVKPSGDGGLEVETKTRSAVKKAFDQQVCMPAYQHILVQQNRLGA